MGMIKPSGFTWNDHHSSFYGLRVSKIPDLNRASRKGEWVSVPGKTGDIPFLQDAYENIERSYEIFGKVKASTTNGIGVWQAETDASATAAEVMAWLHGFRDGDYHELLDDTEPEYYRLAVLENSIDVEPTRAGWWKAEVTFNCRAERFLLDGKTVTKYEENGYIINPCPFNAHPLIKVVGSDAGTVIINDVTLTISKLSDYCYIDCDAMHCYRTELENWNDYVASSTGEFPVFEYGKNKISFTGGIEALYITPNWWTL